MPNQDLSHTIINSYFSLDTIVDFSNISSQAQKWKDKYGLVARNTVNKSVFYYTLQNHPTRQQ